MFTSRRKSGPSRVGAARLLMRIGSTATRKSSRTLWRVSISVGSLCQGWILRRTRSLLSTPVIDPQRAVGLRWMYHCRAMEGDSVETNVVVHCAHPAYGKSLHGTNVHT